MFELGGGSDLTHCCVESTKEVAGQSLFVVKKRGTRKNQGPPLDDLLPPVKPHLLKVPSHPKTMLKTAQDQAMGDSSHSNHKTVDQKEVLELKILETK